MTFFKRRVQKLRRSSRSVRVVQYSIVGAGLAMLCGLLTITAKLSSDHGKISCVKEGKVVLCLNNPSVSPDVVALPLIHGATGSKIPFLEFKAGQEKWKTTALYSVSIGDLMAELSNVQATDAAPVIAFVQDLNREEYFIFIDKNGDSTISSLQFLYEHAALEVKQVGRKKFLGVAFPSATDKKAEPVVYIQRQSP